MLSLEQQNHLREQYRQQFPHWRPATEAFAALVRVYLDVESHLLDVGCGRGGLMEQLGHTLAKSAGIDPDFISLATHRLPNFPRLVAVSHQLPFAHNSFDLIIASWVLEHLAQPAQDFAEIGRVLKPNGRFIFITPHKRHPLIGLNRIMAKLGSWQTRLVHRFYGREAADTFPAFYRANGKKEIEQLGKNAGIYLTHWQIISDPTYWGIFPALYPLLCRLDQLVPANSQLHLVGCLQKPPLNL